MFTVREIREKFLKFFESKGCTIVKSSSVVPTNDPTLLFTNAGMVQFKNYFNGLEKSKFSKATSVQKCIRAGGKHNDLENVGYTARHHTFFEMLGNFSFGDYFKKEAILWAWEFLSEVVMIPKDKLVATVYFTDHEAFDIWKNVVGLPENRIIRISTKDNFWEMGDTGPCGPCSEIFYDHGPEIWGGLPGSPEEDGDRYIEIWNIVFTQFDRQKDGSLKELENKNIDTGMGLERIAAVLQGVHNNFEIDLFKNLIQKSKEIIGNGDIFCHRIIVDHLRSSCFLIADGVLPSNEGRGYVLRRIMRRAMLQIHKLGQKEVSMYKLVPALIQEMGDAYPELKERRELIEETLKIEEQKFRITLESGLKMLEEKTKKIENNKLDGKIAFELYDTYGFPIDLTQMILNENNIELDIDGFEKAMAEQKARSKANWVGSGDKKNNELYLKLSENCEFVGYDENKTNATILKIIKDGKFVDEVAKDDYVEIITDKTVFYGESGGQVGDTGLIILLSKDGGIPLPFSIIQVENTVKTTNGLIVHRGVVEMGKFKTNDLVNLTYNLDRRNKIRVNHTATHLLHYALRKLLGNTVVQKGSYVDDKKLRLDISFNQQISSDILEKVENIVNNIIISNSDIKTEIMNIEKAKNLGAVALFGEKYGENVRVISVNGEEIKESVLDTSDYDYGENIQDISSALQSFSNVKKEEFKSIELCGGTHIKKTGDIGFFKIVKEEALASGIRRIEAITGIEALNYVNEKINITERLSNFFKISSGDLIAKIEGLLLENKELKKQLANSQKAELNKILFEEEKINENIILAYKELKGIETSDIKGLVLNLLNGKYSNNSIVIALCKNENKSVVIVGVSKNILDRYDAFNIIKSLGVNGGGKSHFAMGTIENNIDLYGRIKEIL